MTDLVIYHASCTDGWTAAWAAWRKFGDAAEYVAANYGDEPPEVLGRDVLIVDFSYPRRHLEYMAGVANSLRVFDHHKTAQADLVGLDFCVFDMDRSGAGLTWDELHGGERPRIVDYVEDRDLWHWHLPHSKEVSAWLSSWSRGDFQSWQRLSDDLQENFGGCVAQGKAILRALDRYIGSQVPNAAPVALAGYIVPCINTTFATSELVGTLAETAPFAVGWFERQDGKFVYSLRSRGNDGADVSEIAKSFGGGGHRNAAGFTSETMVHKR